MMQSSNLVDPQQIIDHARVVVTAGKVFRHEPSVRCSAADLIDAIKLCKARGEDPAEWLRGTKLWLQIDYARNALTPGSRDSHLPSMVGEMLRLSVALCIDPSDWAGNVNTLQIHRYEGSSSSVTSRDGNTAADWIDAVKRQADLGDLSELDEIVIPRDAVDSASLIEPPIRCTPIPV